MSARPMADALARFRTAYAEQRAAEGRGTGGRAELLALPWLRSGPHAQAWAVRARTFERFLTLTVAACAAEVRDRPLRVLDLGAGSGWLSHRLRRLGHDAVALDLRADDIDGLGAGAVFASDGTYAADPATAPDTGGHGAAVAARGVGLDADVARARPLFGRIVASFEQLPVRPRTFDIAVFNASLHYATSLETALTQAAGAVRSGGRIAILDSPFYARESAGAAMVAEKHAAACSTFGDRAADLLGLPFIEFLTYERLRRASTPLSLEWRRRRVVYPLRYELRPVIALLRARRAPSRFDLWEARVP